MITPVEYYAIKIEKRLENSTAEFETREEMFEWLKWSVNGGFGTCAAISCDSEWVVKICWDSDYDGYNKYVDWCLDHQGDKFVPEIYKVFSHNTSGLRYVFMKRYQDFSEDIKDIFQNYVSPIAGSRLQGSCFGTNKDKLHNLNILRDGLGDLLLEIHQTMGQEYFMDFHYRNVMCDEEGNWVVTDPLASKRPQPVKPKQVEVRGEPEYKNVYVNVDMNNHKLDKTGFSVKALNLKVHRTPNRGAYWIKMENKFKGRNLRYA